MPKMVDLGQFADANKNIKTEILFDAPPAQKGNKNNKDVQIAFYLTKDDAARLNIIHAKLLAESGLSMSRADRVRGLVLKFIEENRSLLNKS